MSRIVIVEDQSLFLAGLKNIIELETDLKVIGTAMNGLEGLEVIRNLKPDLVLSDIRMPQMNGIDMLQKAKSEIPDLKLLFLTTFDEDEYLLHALKYGACGFMMKDIDADDLINSIRRALAGQWIMPQDLVSKLSPYLQNNLSQENRETQINQVLREKYKLTERELEICDLLAKGMENESIANALYISLGTVKNYLTTIYNKLEVNNRTAAAILIKEII